MPGDFSSTVLLASSIDFRNTKQKNSFKFILFHIFEITSKSSNRNTTTDSRARHSTYLPQPNEPNMRTVLQHFDGNCHKLNTYVPEVLCTYATDPAYDHLSPCSNVTVEHAESTVVVPPHWPNESNARELRPPQHSTNTRVKLHTRACTRLYSLADELAKCQAMIRSPYFSFSRSDFPETHASPSR